MICDILRIEPPPMPWTTAIHTYQPNPHQRISARGVDLPRPAIKVSMFGAAPAMMLPTEKAAILASMTGFLPNMSANRPESRRIAALARPYADPTHMNLSPPWSSSVIVGSAVGMAVRSKALRKADTKMARKDNQKLDPFRLPVEGRSWSVRVISDMEKRWRSEGSG